MLIKLPVLKPDLENPMVMGGVKGQNHIYIYMLKITGGWFNIDAILPI